MRSDPLKLSLQNGALDVVVVLDAVLLGVAGQHQGQSAVAGDVAGSAEAVLQSKDGQHQGGAGVIKHQHASDQAQRGHDRTAGDAGSADGEDAEQQAEQDHGADAGQLAVEDLGDGHAEEHFRQDRAAQMDVGKQGDAKADHILQVAVQSQGNMIVWRAGINPDHPGWDRIGTGYHDVDVSVTHMFLLSFASFSKETVRSCG